ncbi:MAG: lysozyme inhibitor LprI family protein [Candidatus Paracaedibacteraceae bacterium]|nr:lysozyme inhibitor LprI family protein [Candidatus Paracaedibacteraceae bacterium]
MIITPKHSLILTLSISASLATQLPSPSFNCKQATTKDEKTICSDPDLAQLDRLLATLYKFALEIPQIATSIKTAQIQWLKERSSDRDALSQAYEKRINELLSDKTLFTRAINYLLASVKDTQEQADTLTVLLATYLIDHQSHSNNVQPTFEERLISDLYILSDKKALAIYCTFRGPYNTTFKAYIIDVTNTQPPIKEVLFP